MEESNSEQLYSSVEYRIYSNAMRSQYVTRMISYENAKDPNVGFRQSASHHSVGRAFARKKKQKRIDDPRALLYRDKVEKDICDGGNIGLY